MKLDDGRITLLADQEGVTIEINDHVAGVPFVKVRMTPEQFCAALSRMAYTICEVDVANLEKVGKVMEHRELSFLMPERTSFRGLCSHDERIEVAIEEGKLACPEGWEADSYYSSQGSFFKLDGFPYARTTIRRWV